MKERIIAFLFPLIRRWLGEKIDIVFNKFIEIVEEVEEKFRDGSKKREEVIRKMTNFIMERLQLDIIRSYFVSLFFENFIDWFIAVINESIGHGWIEQVREYQEAIKQIKRELFNIDDEKEDEQEKNKQK